jgi:tetratricopeptide (TPR) repeat protein
MTLRKPERSLFKRYWIDSTDRGAEEPAVIENLMAALSSSTAQLGAFHSRTVAAANRLAVAFWRAGDINQAVDLLDQALDALALSSQSEHPVRTDVLCTLGEIMLEQAQWEQASRIYREVLEYCVRRSGGNHASSLAAKGDLAFVLFELGAEREADQLEREAFENARIHLGKTRPVSCVLAWNRAVRRENGGDVDSARTIFVNELLWLLAENDDKLAADQKTIRAMLAKRLNWDAPRVC